MQFNINFGVIDRKRYFDGQYFDVNIFRMWFQFKPLSSLTLGNFMILGDRIDFTHSQLGKIKLFEPSIRWQIGKHLSVNVNHTNQTLNIPGGELFKAKLTDVRLAYQFNTRSRLSLTLQSTNIQRNATLYIDEVDEKTKRFGTQLIYSYKINPQSLVYFGYSDNALEKDQVDNLAIFDKAFFAKFSYLWQT